jgi:lysophospholipase L1-like esterase
MADQDYPHMYEAMEQSIERVGNAALAYEQTLGGAKDVLVPVSGYPPQKTIEGRLAALVDERSLEPVVTSTAAGITATRGTGNTNRFFIVPAEDNVYETRYRNDAGVATLVGRIFKVTNYAPSIIPNGSFRNSGAGNQLYNQGSFQAPVKPINHPTLNGMGCFAGFELAASDITNLGGYVEVDVSAVGHDETLQAFASVLVYSVDGSFDFGTNSGPTLFKVLSDNSSSSVRLTAFTQLTANVRRYTLSWEGAVPTDPTYIKAYRLGMSTTVPRSTTFYATGLWLSLVPKARTLGGSVTIAETQWPDWASGPASDVGGAKALDDRIALSAAVAENTQAIATEKQDRIAADTALGTRIDSALQDTAELAVEITAIDTRVVKLEALEGIFPDIGAGLAATKPSGTVSRTFRVPSDDEVYETRYRNVGGNATIISRVLRQPGKLGSIVPNGNFRNMGVGNSYIGDRRTDSSLQSPVKVITDPTMVSLGCSAGFELAATDTFSTGAMIEVDVSAIGHERTLQVFASLMVFSADGTFDFGSGSGDGPVFYRELSDGTVQGIKMTSFTQLSDKVRRYTLYYPGSVPADTLAIKYMRIGLVTPVPRAKTFQVSGFWISVAPAASVASGNIVLGDTSWPNWASGPASPVGAIKAQDERVSLEARVGKLEKPVDKGLTALVKALRNPMHSVVIGLVGDSITHGVGSVYVPGANPIEAYDVNNAKINFTMKSWANRYRKDIGETYGDSVVMIDGVPTDAVVQDGAGGGYYEKLHLVDPLDGNSNFRWIDTRSGRYIPAPQPTAAAGAMFGKWLDLSTIYRPEFDLVGNNLTIVNAQFVSADPSKVKMEVWDVLTNTKLGEFTWAGSSVMFGKESTITFPWGNYRVQIRDASTGSEFRMRLEGFKVTQRIEVLNYGVSGSGSMSWLPGSANLNQVAARVEFVKYMLGTNDRGNTTQTPLNSSRTKANAKTIANHLISQGKKVIIMCASVALDNAEKPQNPVYLYAMNDVMRALREAANDMGLDFIDNYSPTRKAVVDGETIFSGSDKLHPNDAGHKIMYDTMIGRLYGSQP